MALGGRVRRRRDQLVPVHTHPAAERAAQAIARGRRSADPPDPDWVFFPALGHELDEEDLAAVVRYTGRHQRVPGAVLAAELPHRAVLVQYLHQQAVARYERAVLGLLDDGVAWGVPARVYGPALGLASRQMASNRHAALAVAYREYGVARETAQDRAVRDWLARYRRTLREIADELTGQADTLLAQVPAGRREDVAEVLAAVQAGDTTAVPTPGWAQAVFTLAWLLADPAAGDPIAADAVAAATHLRMGFDAVAHR